MTFTDPISVGSYLIYMPTIVSALLSVSLYVFKLDYIISDLLFVLSEMISRKLRNLKLGK